MANLARRQRRRYIGGLWKRLSRGRGARTAVGILAVAGSVGTLYQLFGWVAVAGFFALLSCVTLIGLLRSRHRIRELQAALPDDLGHLVEFLASTYGGQEHQSVISGQNYGLSISTYRHHFVVRGTDCESKQTIEGRNISTRPVDGVAFALVGGSSVATDGLGAYYSIDELAKRAPEFLVDEERFKVPLCRFLTPLRPQESFKLEYGDAWPGSMRSDADGFFFPEASYFPQGLHSLRARFEFDHFVETMAVLEANRIRGTVRMCHAQVTSAAPTPGYLQAFEWAMDRPDPDVLYIAFYRLATGGHEVLT